MIPAAWKALRVFFGRTKQKKVMSWAKGLAVLVIVCLGFVGTAAALFPLVKRKIMFMPSKGNGLVPSGFPSSTTAMWLQNAGGERLHGLWVPVAPLAMSSPAATVLISHGTGGNVNQRLQLVDFLHQQNCNVCVYDYRGYGASDGSPSETNFYADGELFLNELLTKYQVPIEDVILLGESIGCAVAAALSAKYATRGLVLLGGFSSAAEMLDDFRTRAAIPAFVARFVPEFPTTRFLQSSQAKHRLVLHSKSDEVVGFAHAGRNAEAAQCEVVEVHGGHNNTVWTPDALRAFQLMAAKVVDT